MRELGLRFELRRRRYASYTPVGDTGLLVDNEDPGRRRRPSPPSPADRDLDAWRRVLRATAPVAARAAAPTLLEPLRARGDLRALVGDDEAWRELFERPIGELVEGSLDDDVRGVVLTDALIGTFADPTTPNCGQPLLPLPRDRERHRRVERAGRRHGRGRRRRWPRARAAGAELR